MAKVIDRLRVQGSPAPFVHTVPATPASKAGANAPQNTPHTAVRRDPPPPHVHCVQLVPDARRAPGAAHSRDPGTTGSGSATGGSNAASRRQAHLARVRTANHGLSTMDATERAVPQTPSPRVHFLLRGGPAPGNGSTPPLVARLHTSDGSGKPRTREGVPSRETTTVTTAALSEPRNGLLVEHHAPWSVGRAPHPSRGGAETGGGVEGDDASLPSLSSGICFMLAPTTAPPDAWRRGAGKGGKSGGKTAGGRQGNLELMGRRLANSAPAGQVDSDLGSGLEPWGARTPRRFPRTPHLPPAAGGSPPQLDAGALRQCLLVRQSRHATPLSEDDPIKLKHFTQFVRREGKVNYNNPYRNHKSKERRALGESRKYAFDSVNSYIHFNRIYPQVTGQQNAVPPLSGFPVHCTDTVLLRMMFDMNRPPLRKSSAKYSDVAKSRDLDEYLVVRPPSGVAERPRGRVRSPNKAYSHSLAKSGASQTETAIPEEEAAPAWAGNDVTESQGFDGSEEEKE